MSEYPMLASVSSVLDALSPIPLKGGCCQACRPSFTRSRSPDVDAPHCVTSRAADQGGDWPLHGGVSNVVDDDVEPRTATSGRQPSRFIRSRRATSAGVGWLHRKIARHYIARPLVAGDRYPLRRHFVGRQRECCRPCTLAEQLAGDTSQ